LFIVKKLGKLCGGEREFSIIYIIISVQSASSWFESHDLLEDRLTDDVISVK
jgi:hypothetical protein